MGTISRNGAERNGTELRSKTRNSGGTTKIAQDGLKLVAKATRLRCLPPDSCSTCIYISHLLNYGTVHASGKRTNLYRGGARGAGLHAHSSAAASWRINRAHIGGKIQSEHV